MQKEYTDGVMDILTFIRMKVISYSRADTFVSRNAYTMTIIIERAFSNNVKSRDKSDEMNILIS